MNAPIRHEDTTELLRQIQEHLIDDAGIEATIEHPGCIVIWAEDLATPSRSWWFGTANATWQGDLMDAAGSAVIETRDTGVPSTEQDATRIALAIVKALEGDTW